VAAWLAAPLAAVAAQGCGDNGLQVQVLGSGGTPVTAGRAATSHLVWIEGKARVLVDAGDGAALRFAEAGASSADLDTILFTHLHADHSAGFPVLIESSLAQKRERPLPVYGPPGNRFMPSTVTFVRDLLDPTRGAYRYLGADLLSPLARGAYRLEPHDVRDKPPKLPVTRRNDGEPILAFANARLRALATPVPHGQVPALAWRVEVNGKSVVFAGDAAAAGERLLDLARDADLLVAANAVREEASAEERALYLPPSAIGRLAKNAGVKQLVLSHRTPRTLGHEDETTEHVRRHYDGPLAYANDLDCFKP
jgi:ribonuclease BN (tRNA processing enzyme)